MIARSDNSTFNMTFGGSPKTFARAPLNIETMKQVLENVNTVNIADDDRKIINQVFQDAINTIIRKVLTAVRKKRKSRRYDRFDEVTEPVWPASQLVEMASLLMIEASLPWPEKVKRSKRAGCVSTVGDPAIKHII